MKRILALFIAVSVLVAFGGCTRDYEEIARSEYALDRGDYVSGYDYEYGLSELGDKIQNIYQDDENITELGRDVVDPLVDFDDANIIQGTKYSMPTRMFYYMAVENKSYEKGTSPFVISTEEETAVFWNSLSPESTETIAEQIMRNTKQIALHTMASMYAYEDYGLEMTDAYMESYQSIFNLFGNVDALNEYYAAFGLTDELLKEYLMYFTQYASVKERLVGENSEFYPTEEQAYDFFESECLYLQQIVFSYVEEDENGCIIYKSEEEKQKAKAEGEELYAKILDDPRQFTRNMYKTQHLTWDENPMGYIYVPGDVLPEISDAYFTLMPDEILAIDTPLGYYIIKPLEKNKDVYSGADDMIIRAYCDRVLEGELSKYYENFTFDEAQFTRYEFSKILTQ